MLVTLGIPVFNGETFLEPALDSLLSQDWADIEIVISDNASTDATAEICQEYARRDGRIRYHRQQVNVGAPRNFRTVLDLARGEYFSWAAHDDMRHPSHTRRCMERLLNAEDGVLAYTLASSIDLRGEVIPSTAATPNPFGPVFPESSSPIERFRAVIKDTSGIAVYGVIRSAVLRRARILPIHGWDVGLLAELSLLGKFLCVPEPLLLYRHKIDKSTRDFVKRTSPIINPGGVVRGSRFPATTLAKAHIRTLARSPGPASVRVACGAHVVRWHLVGQLAYPAAGRIARAIGGMRAELFIDSVRDRRWYRRLRGIPD